MNEPDEDFATLFEASARTSRVEKGQTVEGTVVAIGPEVAFVNVGGKGEAMIAIDELKNQDGLLEVVVGDRLQATVVSTHDGVTLSRQLVRAAASAQQIEEAFHARLPVEGRVEGAVKGGYEIRVGRTRAFCPVSQIDTVRGTEAAEHIGRVYTFRITEFKEGGRNLVVSRRALLDEERQAAAADVRRSIVPGAEITGRVVSIRDFGAFVDLGAGVQGLLHVSEMGWSRVADPAQVVSPGETITVKVLRVDEGTQRIALGLKQLTPEPEPASSGDLEAGGTAAGRPAIVAGARITGTVERHARFGVFIALARGLTGLMPMSETDVANEADVPKTFPVGAEVEVVVLDVDEAGRRIRLSRTAVRSAQEAAEMREYTERQGQADTSGFGSLADKLKGALKGR
ncbi:MAG TPA: S1 RNA-binding domain-containing protein [Vicinamibacterales bacterium]|nr:S1 RNA-binding domain-containing protein [Vicinamibacterales bacterium]